jgi:hypothetical protein
MLITSLTPGHQATVDFPILLTDHTHPTTKKAAAVKKKAPINLPALTNLPAVDSGSNAAATAMEQEWNHHASFIHLANRFRLHTS